MKPVFADTSYFLALLNIRDEAHPKASEFSQTHDQPLLTTVWVFTEALTGDRHFEQAGFIVLLK